MSAPIELRVVRLRASARVPERQSDLASGFDLHASIEGPELAIGESPVLVPTGIALAAPPGVDVQIRPRSGLSRRGVMVVLGTLDADYRGELMVTMYCLAPAAPFVVRDGDRIAQLVISRLVDARFEEVDGLEETARGAGGHGSTGIR